MTTRKNNIPFLILAISLGILAALSGVLFWNLLEQRQGPGASEKLVVLPQPRVIADFELHDHHGQPFSLADWQGHWSVLFFGFTSCPDICPNTLYQLQQVRQQLQAELPDESLPQFYLVSVDPGRDTPEKMAGYLEFFDPEFTGVTGNDRQLRALTLQLGVMYHIGDGAADSDDYTVDHSASLLVLNPSGQLHAVFPAPHDVDGLVTGLHRLLQERQS